MRKTWNAIWYGLFVCVSLVLLPACSGEVVTSSPEEGVTASKGGALTFDNFSPAIVSGVWTLGPNNLEFNSHWTATNRTVEFFSQGRRLGGVTYTDETGEFAIQAALQENDRRNLGALVAELKQLDEQTISTSFGENPRDTAIGLLYAMAEHYSTAPINRSLQKSRFVGSMNSELPTVKSFGGEGIQYLWECHKDSRYKVSLAEWTDWRGNNSYNLNCGSWGTACQGRCGVGCTCNSWYCVNRYITKDCFDHDSCLDYNPGENSTSPLAPNCGDEWLDAGDDFIFGSSSGWKI